MLHVLEWHNGAKGYAPFSDLEMDRRQTAMRDWMDISEVDAALFTSPQCILYFAGWMHRPFGRKYGMVLTRAAGTTISAGVDGGQAWRHSYGPNVTYTDWRRDNFYRAVRQLTAGVKRLAIEFDHVSLDFRRLLDAALPGVEMVDLSLPAMWLRTVKSPEEQDLLRKGAKIAEIGFSEAIGRVAGGVPEFEVATAATTAMIAASSDAFPHIEPMESWTWFQSGINTDGAHNPVTNRRIARGDILSLTCCPMLFGYSVALGRTLFCGHVDDASLALWEKNLAVHRRAIELVRPGAKCNEIAAELNEMYRNWGLLRQRSCGYGHSAGVTGPFFGREQAVELREDVQTELQAGMAVSVGPMILSPAGSAGAGGYHETDLLIVTSEGAERLTSAPMGPAYNVVG